MDYISVREAAARWRTHIRVVQALCSEGRIPGAQKFGRAWMIPESSAKPADPRSARKLPGMARPVYLFLTSADLPKDDPDAALLTMGDSLQPLAAADVAFRRGDPEPAKAVWRETPRESGAKLSAASLATAAAISSGDYALYDEIRRFLRDCAEGTEHPRELALLSLPGTLAAVSMAVPEMTPEWLKNCDFSLFPRELRPFLLYLHALHLRNTGAYADMLGVAKATLALTEKPATFTWLDVYLSVLCAVAASALGEGEQAKRYLDDALALGMPAGFIAPFADSLGDLSGAVEAALERAYPGCRRAVTDLWESSFKNYIRFHNAFAKDHITTVLTAREYQAARLVARGETYAEAARRMHLSVSRVKHILTGVYAKLFVQGKQELNPFIL